ncbi:hypothetical protein [Krasilnikovia sp. MM14-A1259]|uniref:hypothetical protein n=1 Tax=Krasilnikovia sp. MM14-A1259 TaxID=3373539 RepID=UPI0037FDE11A
MAPARSLHEILSGLTGDAGTPGDLAAVLDAGGHPDLPPDLLAEAVVSYAGTAAAEVAEHLAPFVMAHGPIAEGDTAADEIDLSGLLATAPAPNLDDPALAAPEIDPPLGVGDADPAHTSLDHDHTLDHDHALDHRHTLDHGHALDSGHTLNQEHTFDREHALDHGHTLDHEHALDHGHAVDAPGESGRVPLDSAFGLGHDHDLGLDHGLAIEPDHDAAFDAVAPEGDPTGYAHPHGLPELDDVHHSGAELWATPLLPDDAPEIDDVDD